MKFTRINIVRYMKSVYTRIHDKCTMQTCNSIINNRYTHNQFRLIRYYFGISFTMMNLFIKISFLYDSIRKD